MSLSIDGIWKLGVWDQTVWADGVWREGSPAGTHNAIQYFTTGDTVTFIAYDLTSGEAVAIDSSACSEVGTTGLFIWSASNLTVTPVGYKEYGFIMNNGTVSKGGKLQVFDEEATLNIESILAVVSKMAFTKTNELDVNIKSMNEAEVLGIGTEGDQWRGE